MMRLLGILKDHGHGSRGVYECDGLHGLFIPLTEKFGEANRKALQEES